MHKDTLDRLQHDHNFTVINRKGERRARLVMVLTLLTMILEIAAGVVFGSMALLADGWHMGTHVAAFMITLYAYRYSRRHANDETFAFSSGKVGVLGGFASSVALGVVALMMLVESAERILMPHTIQFDHALLVAGFGLFINFVCALLLKDSAPAQPCPRPWSPRTRKPSRPQPQGRVFPCPCRCLNVRACHHCPIRRENLRLELARSRNGHRRRVDYLQMVDVLDERNQPGVAG